MEQVENFKVVFTEKEKLDLLVKKKDEDLRSLNEKLINVINEKESSLQNFLNIQNQKQNSDEKHGFLKSELMNAEREISNLKKQQAESHAEISSLKREKDLLANNIIKMDSLIKKYSNEFKFGENERITLYKELKILQHQAEKQNKIISSLEAVKTHLLTDIENLRKKIENLNNELYSHEYKEISMQEKITELSSKLSQQIDICNAAVLDRKLYCQHYKEVKENKDQLKQKIDVLENYVNELKEQIFEQTQELVTRKNKSEALDIQNKNLLAKFINEQSEHNVLKNQQKHLEQQLQSYLQSIHTKEKEVEELKSKVNHITEECMMLRSQLHQLNQVIYDLEKKLRLFDDEVKREQELYINLQHSCQLLKKEILRLTGEKQSLISKVNDLEKLKQSFTYAKQELDKERFKSSVLEKEMQQPRNIHRWRLLKGTDPEKHELLENYQTVQKKLLEKSIESEKKDQKLSNMARLVQQLRTLTSRQDQFKDKCLEDFKHKQLLKDKNNKIKGLTFEVDTCRCFIRKYEDEINRLENELKKQKITQYFKQKKKISPQQVKMRDATSTFEGSFS